MFFPLYAVAGFAMRLDDVRIERIFLQDDIPVRPGEPRLLFRQEGAAVVMDHEKIRRHDMPEPGKRRPQAPSTSSPYPLPNVSSSRMPTRFSAAAFIAMQKPCPVGHSRYSAGRSSDETISSRRSTVKRRSVSRLSELTIGTENIVAPFENGVTEATAGSSKMGLISRPSHPCGTNLRVGVQKHAMASLGKPQRMIDRLHESEIGFVRDKLHPGVARRERLQGVGHSILRARVVYDDEPDVIPGSPGRKFAEQRLEMNEAVVYRYYDYRFHG